MGSDFVGLVKHLIRPESIDDPQLATLISNIRVLIDSAILNWTSFIYSPLARSNSIYTQAVCDQ
jgi:hypothetical protein